VVERVARAEAREEARGQRRCTQPEGGTDQGAQVKPPGRQTDPAAEQQVARGRPLAPGPGPSRAGTAGADSSVAMVSFRVGQLSSHQPPSPGASAGRCRRAARASGTTSGTLA
jgi:hypothetical protein